MVLPFFSSQHQSKASPVCKLHCCAAVGRPFQWLNSSSTYVSRRMETCKNVQSSSKIWDFDMIYVTLRSLGQCGGWIAFPV